MSPAIYRRWDLDHLSQTDKWQVLLNPRADAEKHFHRLRPLDSGTCVLWQNMDRVVRGFDLRVEHHDLFLMKCEQVRQHLGLVFHQILETEDLSITTNGVPVVPSNPFFVFEATQTLQETEFPSSGGTVRVEPFVLPHHSKLVEPEDIEAAGDVKEWTARQGFYIYRQNRLLVAGSWLGYRDWRKDELHKLARIRISLPNTSDEDWQIDVTKCKARPPYWIRESLQQIGERTRSRAKLVFSSRGERIHAPGKGDIHHVWEAASARGNIKYSINRNHPNIISLLASSIGKDLESTLRMIEQSIPIALISYAVQERANAIEEPVVSAAETESVQAMLLQAWRNLLNQGNEHATAMQILCRWEPFNRFPALLQRLKESPPEQV